MNYTELVALLDGTDGYLHRSDLTSLIPSFITLAQARMNHDLKTPLLDSTSTIALTASTSTASLPTDCRKVKSIRIPYNSGYRELQQHTLAAGGEGLESYNGTTATPKFYARYGQTIEVSPTPAADATCTIVYQAKLAALSGMETDNILTWYPNIYVYAVMLEAQPWLVNDKRISIFGKMYENEVTRINEEGAEMLWSDSPKQPKFLGNNTP